MPLLWVSLAFIIGAGLAPLGGGSPLLWVLLSVILLVCEFTSKKIPHWKENHHRIKDLAWVSVFVLLASFCLGSLRGRLAVPHFTDHDLAAYNGTQRITLSGRLVNPPDVLDNAVQLDIAVDEIVELYDVDVHLPVQGRCLLRVQSAQNLKYGDRIVFRGSLQTPSDGEEFSYRDYLAVKGIYSSMYYGYIEEITPGKLSPMRLLFDFRNHAYAVINAMLPQPEAGLLSGILLGMERDIPASVEQDFQDTGTTHIIAISGFNIALVAGLLTLLLDKVIGKKLAPAGVIGGIFLYTLLVGAQAAVVRAAIMGSLSLMGRQIGRRSSGTNTLCFTAAIMVGLNPLILQDVGFQLSFAATLGLVLFAGPWQEGLTKLITTRFSEQAAARLSAPISEYFLFTLAAQITTLPIIIYHFGRLSISSFLTNPLILPAQPLIMILGGPLVLLGMLFLPLGKILIWLIWPLLYYTIHVVGLMARWHGGVMAVNSGLAISVVLVIFMLLVLWLMRNRHPKLALWLRPTFLLVVLIMANVFLWREVFRRPDDRLHLTIHPAQDCTVLLIKTPANSQLLYNTGKQASAINTLLGDALPIFDRNLELVLIPQDKSACYAAMPKLMERFTLQNILFPPEMKTSGTLTDISTLGSTQNTALITEGQAAVIQVDGVEIKNFPAQNGASSVQEIQWHDFSALFVWAGNAPCGLLSQQNAGYTLYVDARPAPQPLAQECPGISAQIQTANLAAGSVEGFDIDLSEYERISVETDGEQLWLNGLRP